MSTSSVVRSVDLLLPLVVWRRLAGFVFCGVRRFERACLVCLSVSAYRGRVGHGVAAHVVGAVLSGRKGVAGRVSLPLMRSDQTATYIHKYAPMQQHQPTPPLSSETNNNTARTANSLCDTNAANLNTDEARFSAVSSDAMASPPFVDTLNHSVMRVMMRRRQVLK